MQVKSVITNLIPVFILTAAFEGSLIMGLLTVGNPIVVIFVFPVLYFVFYFITKANNIDFPLYFFIAMNFQSANTSIGAENKISLFLYLSIGILLLVSFISIFKSVKQKQPMVPSCGIVHVLSEKYKEILKNDPKMWRRILIHSAILFAAGIIGYLLLDNHGYWVLITCGAVFIGDELEVLKKRGYNLVFGLIIGCIIASIIGYFHITLVIRGLVCFAAMIVASRFMPKVASQPKAYIIGSSMVAMSVMIMASMSQSYLTKDIVFDRFLCGLIGIILAIVSTAMFNHINNKIYQ